MKEIRSDLQAYINRSIIPVYQKFDKAHGIEHVSQVIEKSLYLAEQTGANKEMVYVIAAYHDLGMRISRKQHSFYSAKILKEDPYIECMFLKDQRNIMAQAVADHSTSLEKKPKTLYGEIIYQADKTLDAENIIKRAIQFGTANYKDYTFTQHVNRVYDYVNSKYGEKGKVKLWIDIPEEHAKLRQLQKKIKDRNYVCGICGKYYK